MTSSRISALLGAALLSTLAAIGSLDHWDAIAPFLRTASLTAWILFVVVTCAERIIDEIRKLRADVDTYGEQRHSDGVIDGMSRQVPAQPNLSRIR